MRTRRDSRCVRAGCWHVCHKRWSLLVRIGALVYILRDRYNISCHGIWRLNATWSLLLAASIARIISHGMGYVFDPVRFFFACTAQHSHCSVTILAQGRVRCMSHDGCSSLCSLCSKAFFSHERIPIVSMKWSLSTGGNKSGMPVSHSSGVTSPGGFFRIIPAMTLAHTDDQPELFKFKSISPSLKRNCLRSGCWQRSWNGAQSSTRSL